jgi:hypothetical protein
MIVYGFIGLRLMDLSVMVVDYRYHYYEYPYQKVR